MNNSIPAYLNLAVQKVWMSSKLQLNIFKTVSSHLKTCKHLCAHIIKIPVTNFNTYPGACYPHLLLDLEGMDRTPQSTLQ